MTPSPNPAPEPAPEKSATPVRYTPYCGCGYGTVERHLDGNFILYDDYKKLETKLARSMKLNNEQMKAALGEAEERAKLERDLAQARAELAEAKKNLGFHKGLADAVSALNVQADDTIKALREALEKVLPLAITGASANAESHNFTGDFFTEDKLLIEAARQALASTQEDAKPEQPPSIQVGDVMRVKKGIEPYSKSGDIGTVVVIDNEGDYWIDFKGRGDSLVEGNGVMCACPDHVEFVRRPSTQEDAP